MHSVILKKGKELIFRNRHHWIFSGAIASYPEDYQDGDLVSIANWREEPLGWGFFNRSCSLAGRIVSFGKEDVQHSLKNNLSNALQLRSELLANPLTTACRLVNGEGDGIPGLIVDKYGPYLVIQTGALGMQKLLPCLIDFFKKNLHLEGIYDKSSSKEEGMETQGKILWGQIPDRVTILEEGISYLVDIKKGQKTGFFFRSKGNAQDHWPACLSQKSTQRLLLHGRIHFSCAARRGNFCGFGRYLRLRTRALSGKCASQWLFFSTLLSMRSL